MRLAILKTAQLNFSLIRLNFKNFSLLSELVSNSIRATGHTVQVVLDICEATEKEGIFDLLDDLSEEIEREIEKDETFSKTVDSCILTHTQMGKNDEGEKVIGFLRMIYECRYLKQKTPKVDPNLPRLQNIRIGD